MIALPLFKEGQITHGVDLPFFKELEEK